MKRTLAIGDIHGGFKAFTQVLERAAVTENDTLIFLGDYVDGWSESSEIIQFLLNLPKSRNVFLLKEIMMHGRKTGLLSGKVKMYGFSMAEKVR